MNLRQIIRESINSVILDSIISDAILNEVTINEKNYNAGKKKQRGYNRKQKQQDLQQKQQQNVSQTTKTPQGGVTQTPQGGTTQTSQDSAGQTNATNQQQPTPQQPTPQEVANFKQFADELRKLVGNSGINAKPVQNNQAAAQHIVKLNRFVYAVINAIDNGNIDAVNSAAAGNGYSRYNNQYGKDKTDIARDAMRSSVNYLGGQAENLLGNGAGLQNNPLNGVFSAGVNAYNNTNNLFTQQINNRRYADMYGDSNDNKNGYDLYNLMTRAEEGCFPGLYREFQQLNQQNNGIFSATPNVGNCYDVLLNLSRALQQYKSQKAAQNKKQTINTTQTTNTTQPTQGGGEVAPTTNTGGETNPTDETPVNTNNNAEGNPLDEDWENTVDELGVLQEECYNFALKNDLESNVKNLAGWLSVLLKRVVSASDENNEEQLMELLSLNDNNDDDLLKYNGAKSKFEYVNQEYGNSPENSGYLETMSKAIKKLGVLRSQLRLLRNNSH
jgi:hypothetical protein